MTRPLHPLSVLLHSFAALALLAVLLAGCGLTRELRLSGKTMGTTYHITILAGYLTNRDDLQARIERRLEEINQSMSTYRPESEISRFNALTRTYARFPVSEDFWQVLTVAREVHRLTAGAWDGTVKPLVDLWGFGSRKTTFKIPAPAEIDASLATVGFQNIEMAARGYLIKCHADVTLDLASIAKGYAVDQLAVLLRSRGLQNFLVEIGGEVYASGFRQDRRPWRVGVNQPQKNSPSDQVYKVVELHDQALATSGDYRIFFEMGGKRYTHVIDPRNGFPVSNGVVSVSVLADTCTLADGLATGLMVMGPSEGLALVNRLPRVESLIIVQGRDGTLSDHFSAGFKTIP